MWENKLNVLLSNNSVTFLDHKTKFLLNTIEKYNENYKKYFKVYFFFNKKKP